MKKLLALILCVMMFVAVIPTSAFAGGLAVDNPLHTSSQYAKEIKDMLKDTREGIESAYGVLIMDKSVYATAKAMDDVIVGLVDGIGNTLIEKDKLTKANVDAVKASVRAFFDAAVAKKIDEGMYKALNNDGSRDPIAYAQLVANSVSSALTDKNFQKGYEAVLTFWALGQIASDVNDQLKKDFNAWAGTVDPKFSKDFAKYYTALVDEYIDTFDTAAAKELNNKIAKAAFDALMLPVEAQKNADAAAAKSAYDATVNQAKSDKANAVKAADQAMNAADVDWEKAQVEYEKAVLAGHGTPDAAALQAYADAMQAHSEAEAKYTEDLAKADANYNKSVNAADDQFDMAMLDVNSDYKIGVIENTAEWAENYHYEVINPWAVDLWN